MDAEGPDTDPAGRKPKVPGYHARRRLGVGGSAVVWLVEEEATGRQLALKCFGPLFPPQQARSHLSRPGGSGAGVYPEEDIRRELLIMSVLDHGHLVKAHEVVTVGDGPDSALGILMDYAPGGSLGQLVAARGRLSVGETVTVLTPVAQALAYLHGKGFTHSDVSPGNVLFSGHGKPLLADVGTARMVGDGDAVPDAGTAGFQDPSPVDAVRAGLQPGRDVYAAAAVGWYCLTGAPPPPAADRPPLSVLAPDVPRELAAALEAGLNEDRRQRPDATELATAVYRSAPAAPVDLSRSVDPSVLPQLLTRRPEPPARSRHRERLGAWRRRLHTSGLAKALRRRRSTGTSPGRHSRRSAAPSRNRARAVWAALAALAVIVDVWMPLPPSPELLPADGPTAAEAGGTSPSATETGTTEPGTTESGSSEPATAEPGTTGPTAGSPVPAMVPGAVRRQVQSANPVEAVKGLAALRAFALSRGRLELLREVNAANSPAASADARITARLQESGSVLEGFTTALTGIRRLPESSNGRAVVAVTAVTSGYVQRSAGGTVAASPAQAAVDLRLVLLKVKGRWLISEILAAR
ncbi:protein kinase domain-containing protein [Arthrobacter sp. D1-17]